MKTTLCAWSQRVSLAFALVACIGSTIAEADESLFGLSTNLPGPSYETAFLNSEDAGLIDAGDESDGGDIDSDAMVPLKDYQKLLDRVGDLESSWEGYQDKLKSDSDAKKKKPSGKLNGRVHLDNWNFLDSDAGINELESGNANDDPEDRWDFRRVRLTWTGQVPHNMLYRIQIDFNNPSSAEMKDVYLGFNNLPHNQTFLIGNQKRPIGLDHLNSSRHNVFVERPLSVEAFNEDARRLGAALYGYRDDESVNWRAGVYLLENISRDGRYRGDFGRGWLVCSTGRESLVRRN